MEGTDHIGIERELVICCGDFSAGNEGVGRSDVRNQDVDLADLLENGRDAVKVCDGRSVRGDFGVWIFGLKRRFRFAENLLSSLYKDEMLNAGFGEGFRNGEADTACLKESVVEQPSLRRSDKPPPVISTVLSLPSNVVDGEIRS